jgi:hypothetical protein
MQINDVGTLFLSLKFWVFILLEFVSNGLGFIFWLWFLNFVSSLSGGCLMLGG